MLSLSFRGREVPRALVHQVANRSRSVLSAMDIDALYDQALEAQKTGVNSSDKIACIVFDSVTGGSSNERMWLQLLEVGAFKQQEAPVDEIDGSYGNLT